MGSHTSPAKRRRSIRQSEPDSNWAHDERLQQRWEVAILLSLDSGFRAGERTWEARPALPADVQQKVPKTGGVGADAPWRDHRRVHFLSKGYSANAVQWRGMMMMMMRYWRIDRNPKAGEPRHKLSWLTVETSPMDWRSASAVIQGCLRMASKDGRSAGFMDKHLLIRSFTSAMTIIKSNMNHPVMWHGLVS